MKPTKILIRALRETAETLRREPCRYAWIVMDRCNCGLLAQHILGVTHDELQVMRRRDKMPIPWMFWETCPITGENLKEVFTRLLAAGIERKDFYEIEMKAGKDAPTVALWMDRKADELERQRSNETSNQVGL